MKNFQDEYKMMRVLYISIFLMCYFCMANASQNMIVGGDIEMVYIEGGEFKMGSKDGEKNERPLHDVKLNSFYISKHEITNTQYCAFLNEKGNQEEGGSKWIDMESRFCFIEYKNDVFTPKIGFEKKPVTAVTWYGANAFCEWNGGRLPTESEWEYTVRGGKQKNNYSFSGSNNAAEVAWFVSTSGGRPQDVEKKKKNSLGVHDMSGNAWEWVHDWHGLYGVKEYENPKGPETGKYKIIRGGSWTSFGVDNLRNTARIVMLPDEVANVGFRLCLEVEKEDEGKKKKTGKE